MKLCPKCGRPYPDEALFCMMDATPLEAAAVPAPAPVVETVAPVEVAEPPADEPVKAPKRPRREPRAAAVDDKESRRARAAESLSQSFSRMRNPWSAPLYEHAPDTLNSALVARGARSLERNPTEPSADDEEKKKKPFSETLWFLEGDDPGKLQELEAQGAAQRDDGQYIKRGQLPKDIRERLSLAR